jgi:multiple sugar transport system substrate-binding protein
LSIGFVENKHRPQTRESEMTRKWLAYAFAALGLVSPALAQSTISFGYWGDPPELPPFEEIVSKYQAAHPDVKIEIQHAP